MLAQAIAVTVANFVLEPLEHIGRHLGRFIRSTMAELPIHLQAVILPLLVVMILMVVMMVFGYRIRLFHFIGFEPSPTLPSLPTNDSASHRVSFDRVVIHVPIIIYRYIDLEFFFNNVFSDEEFLLIL